MAGDETADYSRMLSIQDLVSKLKIYSLGR